ncbi:MAG: lysophospholipid acyltransferase family protein [Gammaproteobacteria bacterium]|nr:lysophospholipid acyltransferase family protein [Gammaproteobacteria bacterium]
MFSIENIIKTQYPSLHAKHNSLVKPLTAFLRLLFHESEVQSFENKYQHLTGMDFVEQVLDYFDFNYTVSQRCLEKIPSYGKIIIVANHPIGTLDGLALLKMVHKVRPDVKVVANQMLATMNAVEPLLLPVDNINGKTAKDNIKDIIEFVKNDSALIIFPAGEVSRFSPKGIKDGEWNKGFLNIANSTKAPILPVHINGRNSVFFYALSIVAKPLSTFWLVNEMFKQENKSIIFKIGDKIEHDSYSQHNVSLRDTAALFKRHVYMLGANKKLVFRTQEAIAHPECRQRLRKELNNCQLLGETDDNKKIYLFEYRPDTSLMREIGRLRELSFRAVGEGTGRRRDIDKYDREYMHLILWDEAELEIAGAYRLCDTNKILSYADIDSIYTTSLFKYEREMKPYLYRGLELGRSFVQPRYWGKRSLDYLWYGIGALLRNNPQYRYLFGPVTISNTYPQSAKDALVHFYTLYFGTDIKPVAAFLPYQIDDKASEALADVFAGDDYNKDFKKLKSILSMTGHTVPTLYKQYTEICEEGGIIFSDFNIDPEFSDCVDGFIIVDIDKIKPKKKKRYMGEK